MTSLIRTCASSIPSLQLSAQPFTVFNVAKLLDQLFCFYLSSVWCLHTVVCSPHGCLLRVWVCICFLMVVPPQPLQKCLKTTFEQHSESHRLDKPSVQSDLFTTSGASRYQPGASCWCDFYHASCCDDLSCKLTNAISIIYNPGATSFKDTDWFICLFIYFNKDPPLVFAMLRLFSTHKQIGVYILKTIQIAVFQDESVRITSDCICKV